MSKTYIFKSNIKCEGCIAVVSPYLDDTEGIVYWSVDTDSADKILKVEVTKLNEKDIQQLITSAGFKATPIQS